MADYGIDLKAGTYLQNRYVIQNTIGQGGFGITYQAYDMDKQQKCAIKEFVPKGIVIRLQDGLNITTVSESKLALFLHGKDRFLDEAGILQRLNYVDSVVSVYDFFLENGTCYFVMEYLDGITLGKLIHVQGGHLPYNIVEDVLKQAGSALIEVHSYKIFHRDISPDNIFVTSEGKIKLIDFGNAKNLIRNDKENLSIVLKPGFAPPEQYSMSGVQGTFTDVYALASTVYYCLTGHMLPDAMRRSQEGYTKLADLGFDEYISDAIDNALELSYKNRTKTIDCFLANLHINTGKTTTVMTTGKAIPVMFFRAGTPQEVKYKLILNEGMIVGKSRQKAHIVVDDDPYVSRKHCEIFYDSASSRFYIADYSTNGTFIDGWRLQKGQWFILEAGRLVSLGGTGSTFKVGVVYE